MAKKLSSLQPRNDVIKNALRGMMPELEDSQFRVDFYCECTQDTCPERIGLLVSEYQQAHRDSAHKMVKPQHATTAARVIERHPRYWIVERTASAG